MARHLPGQLSLFDDVPAGLLATSEPAGPWQPEPRPDQLLLVLPIGGKAAGALIGVGESLADRYGLGAPAFLDLFYLPVFDLGRADELPERQLASLMAAAEKLALPRLTLTARRIGPALLGDDAAAVALQLEASEALDQFVDYLGDGLRLRGLGDYLNAADRSVIALGRTLAVVPEIGLGQPLALPVREFALVRVSGVSGAHHIVQQWALRP